MKKMCDECPFKKGNYCSNTKFDQEVRSWKKSIVEWWKWSREFFSRPKYPIQCHKTLKKEEIHSYFEKDLEFQCVGFSNYVKKLKK